ncbi:calcium-binding protein [Zavarzinia aquatilis]|uniref:Calcium-binding protein n=1 Tax=Zavarzinia aquatilis TaxID=2211142 RepID=A0A317EDF8_9PROT|nr:calcium-binding protein [Zavarzinia aquatilis]PWR24180.1 hypothetical protein DKG74_08665 [Zavarzinia aquatilis]
MADIRGTTSAETLDGADGVTSGADDIYGRGGNDIVFGFGGDDFIADGAWSGGPARVAFNFAAHGFSTWSSGGNDEFHGGSGDDEIFGDGGDDRLFGDGDDDILHGGLGNDTLDGGSGNDILFDDAGSETILGGSGTDIVRYDIAGTGDEEPSDSEPLFPVGVKGVFVDMEAGRSGFAFTNSANNRIADVSYSSVEIFEMDASRAQADEFRGDNTAQTVRGFGGDDILEGRGGADTLDGGDGNDTASYESAPTGVSVSIRTADINIIIGNSDELGDRLISIENLTGSAFGDFLGGGDGANILKGLGGNDVLDGRGGADRLDGGTGTDTADYQISTAGVTISTDGSAGTGGFAEGDRLTSVENVIGSRFRDIIKGESKAVANVFEGRDGNDDLFGLAGDDTLAGGLGINLIDGGTGTDTVSYRDIAGPVSVSLQDFGSGGNASASGLSDTIFGIENVDGTEAGDFVLADDNVNRLRGFGGADDLRGNGGDDDIQGGDGDDILMGGTGGDRLNGGVGTDTATYRLSQKPVHVDLTLGQGFTGEAAGDILTSIENLIGSSHDDRLIGDKGINELSGLGGDDTLIGGGSKDKLSGGDGFDTASYETAAFAITLNLATPAANSGDAAGDTFFSIERWVGSAFADVMSGDDAGNRFDGGASGDTLIGQSGDDVLHGDGGDDRLDGGLWNDQLFGDAGDDTLIGAGGADALDGGDGTDTASYAGAASRIALDMNDAGFGRGDAAGDTFVSVEIIEGTAFDDEIRGAVDQAMTLRGGRGADTLVGGNLADTLQGGGENDVLIGGIGGDTLDGGDGFDTASYENSIRSVVLDLRTAPEFTSGDATGDSFVSIEAFRGSQFIDIFIGGDQDLSFEGLGSSDNFIAGAGRENFDGGQGADRASYFLATAGITLDLADGSLNTGFATGDTYRSIESFVGSDFADTLRGGGDGDTLSGGGDADLMDGRGGDDTLQGDGGDDVLAGGAGADTLNGGDGVDTASYADSAGVTVSLDGARAGTGDAEGDTFSGIENILGSATGRNVLRGDDGRNELIGGDDIDKLEGQGGQDTLRGGRGDDRLFGGGENDTLFGGRGNDTLSGGSGRDFLRGEEGDDTLTGGTQLDRFLFTARDFGHDTITDWEDGIDLLRVTGTVADDLSDFAIAGDGTTVVTLTLLADPTSVIEIRSAAAFTIAASDFEFV